MRQPKAAGNTRHVGRFLIRTRSTKQVEQQRLLVTLRLDYVVPLIMSLSATPMVTIHTLTSTAKARHSMLSTIHRQLQSSQQNAVDKRANTPQRGATHAIMVGTASTCQGNQLMGTTIITTTTTTTSSKHRVA